MWCESCNKNGKQRMNCKKCLEARIEYIIDLEITHGEKLPQKIPKKEKIIRNYRQLDNLVSEEEIKEKVVKFINNCVYENR